MTPEVVEQNSILSHTPVYILREDPAWEISGKKKEDYLQGKSFYDFETISRFVNNPTKFILRQLSEGEELDKLFRMEPHSDEEFSFLLERGLVGFENGEEVLEPRAWKDGREELRYAILKISTLQPLLSPYLSTRFLLQPQSLFEVRNYLMCGNF